MLETVLSHLKLIFSTSAKKSIRLNPSDLVDKLAMFISGQIEEKRRLGLKLKEVIEKGYDEYKTANRPRLTNLKEIAPKQCCHYDGETKYSTKFQRWVDTKSVTVTFILNALTSSCNFWKSISSRKDRSFYHLSMSEKEDVKNTKILQIWSLWGLFLLPKDEGT